MIRALEKAQAPAYVSFRAPLAAPAGDGPEHHHEPAGGTDTTADLAAGSTTDAGTRRPPASAGQDGHRTAAGAATRPLSLRSKPPASSTRSPASPGCEPARRVSVAWRTRPSPCILPREDAAELVDLVRSIGFSFGLHGQSQRARPPGDGPSSICAERLLEHKRVVPGARCPTGVAAVPSGATISPRPPWRPTRARRRRTARVPLPDEAGTHVIVVIWIAE